MTSDRASRLLLRSVLPALGVGVLELARRRRSAAAVMRDRLTDAEADHHRELSTRLHVARETLAADVRERVRAEIDTLSALGLEVERLIARREADVVERRLDRVSAVSYEALEGLRRLLDDTAPSREQLAARPALEAIPDAVLDDRLRALALRGPLVVRRRGDATLTSPRQLLAAARLVESVLGAARWPAAMGVRVRIDYRPGDVAVTVSGRGSGPVPLTDPAALAALRELGRLHGGTVRVGGGPWRWRVRASFPSAAGFDDAAPTLPRRWDDATTDAALALAASALVLVDVAVLPVQRPRTSAVLGIATASGPLALRRRYPSAVCALAAGGLIAGAALEALPSGPAPAYFIITVVPFSAASHASSVGRAVLGVALTTAGAVASETVRARREAAPTDRVTLALHGTLVGALAWSARHHHGRALALAADEEQLRLRYPAVLADALAGQRDAVARDLHDVVAHGITLVGVVAGAARVEVGRGDWLAAERSAQALRAAAAESAIELRRLLDTLQAGAAPTHRLTDLEVLAEQARRSGHPVALRWEISPDRRLSDAHAGLTYRCVQEALSNVRRHAGAAATTVTVRDVSDALVVEVVNDPPAAGQRHGRGTGRGLAAMDRRARDLGGHAAAGPDAAGGFRVTLRLPVGLSAA